MMALLGLGLGGAGAFAANRFSQSNAEERRKRLRDEERAYQKQIKEEDKAEREAEEILEQNKEYKREGRFTEGDRRGELIDPGIMDMFGAEHDPVHDWIEGLGGQTMADILTGTTAYDTSLPIDERI